MAFTTTCEAYSRCYRRWVRLHFAQRFLRFDFYHQLVLHERLTSYQIPGDIVDTLGFQDLLEIRTEKRAMIHARIKLVNPIDISEVAFGSQPSPCQPLMCEIQIGITLRDAISPHLKFLPIRYKNIALLIEECHDVMV